MSELTSSLVAGEAMKRLDSRIHYFDMTTIRLKLYFEVTDYVNHFSLNQNVNKIPFCLLLLAFVVVFCFNFDANIEMQISFKLKVKVHVW